jgi:hypothetical protein
MRRLTTFVLAAALGGGVGFGTGQWASAADEARHSAAAAAEAERNPPQLPDGFQLKDLNQLDNIREELSKATDTAMTAGDFGKFIGHLAVFNRDRMKDFKDQDFKTLDGVVNQINEDWKAKYGHEFRIKHANDLWTDRYTIVQGVVTNAHVAAENFPVPAERREGAQAAAHKESGQARDVEAQDLQDSSGVALVRFPAEQDLPGLTASMIAESHGTWRFAIPPEATSQQLHTRLQNQLTYLGHDMNKWPADENMAYRLATHRVLMALYGIDNPREQTR